MRPRSALCFLMALAGVGCTGAVEPQPQVPTVVTDLPCDIEALMAKRCWACHGQTPTAGAPALTNVAAFMAPALTTPSQTVGAVAVARMQSTTAAVMPPPPSAPATATEIAVLSAWVGGGYVGGAGCGPICTSGTTWRGGNKESPLMNPGMACIQCHSSDEGPRFSIAGTLYPTVHEPDLCNGAGSAGDLQVVITGADGKTLRLTPNAVGNFFSETRLALPYQAKVIAGGAERAMAASQTSGDCNQCHTPDGANGAPGRIMPP